MLGNQDLQTARPVRILLFKTNNQRVEYPFSPAVIDGRDRWAVLLSADAPITTEVFRECATAIRLSACFLRAQIPVAELRPAAAE